MRKNTASRVRTVHIGQHRISTHGLVNHFWTDLYHLSMTIPWIWFTLACILLFLALNSLFATLYLLSSDSIANAENGDFFDYFFFSIETLSTVGYGDMYPQSPYGRVISIVEIFTGLAFITTTTGLVFARFSRPQARLIFATHPVIGLYDGKRALMIRMANARHNDISDARTKIWLGRSERTWEGIRLRRNIPLPLLQDENPLFILSWTVVHMIDETSPLFGLTSDDLKKASANIIVSVNGLDESAAQDVHVRKIYTHTDIRFDHQYVDMVDSEEEGHTRINYGKFHDIVPTAGKQ